MSPQDARELLAAHAPTGEVWPLHCRQVARVAVALGTALRDAGTDLDLEDIEVQALLHDLGRCRTHGPYHGWAGFVMLRARGHAAAGRGCLTHWLKGRQPDDLRANTHFRERFVERVYAALEPPDWTLEDSVLSVADSSVRHSTVVSFADRYDDLFARYGHSLWLQQARDLTDQHAADLAARLGRPVADLLRPLYGDTLE